MTAAVSLERPLVPWWLILLEGIAAVIIGILLLVSPAQTILILVQVLGFYWLITGILSLVGIFVDSSMYCGHCDGLPYTFGLNNLRYLFQVLG